METTLRILVLILLPLVWGLLVEFVSDRLIQRHRRRRDNREVL